MGVDQHSENDLALPHVAGGTWKAGQGSTNLNGSLHRNEYKLHAHMFT